MLHFGVEGNAVLFLDCADDFVFQDWNLLIISVLLKSRVANCNTGFSYLVVCQPHPLYAYLKRRIARNEMPNQVGHDVLKKYLYLCSVKNRRI